MEKYYKKIKKRMIWEGILTAALIPVAVFTAITIYKMDSPISGTIVLDFLGGVLNGALSSIVIGFIIFLISVILQNRKALKDEGKLKELFIAEHDERMNNINSTASKMSFNIILYIIIVAALVFGWWNTIISITLFCVWLFIVIVRVIVTYVYNKKM